MTSDTEHQCRCEQKDRIRKIVSGFKPDKSSVIPALQAVQDEFGYIPSDTFLIAGQQFGVPASRVYGVATFYAQFHLQPRGRHTIKVCQGTACHVRGSGEITAALEKHLGVKTDQTTPDLKFTLERVTCFGSCALAPVVLVDDKVYAQMTAEHMTDIVDNID